MKTLLIKIANFLVMNLHTDMGVGLLKGKMGIAIFLYHYSRYANSKVYEDIADRLIDDILARVNARLPMDIFDGVLGVSLGLKHLTKHGYIEIEEQDVNLLEVEKKYFDLHLNRVDEKNINWSLSKFYIMSLVIDENNKMFDSVIINFFRIYNSSFSKEKLSEIPLIVINSMLFFILSAEKADFHSNDIKQFKFKMLTYLGKRINYDREDNGDLYVLTQLIRQITSLTGRDVFSQIIFPFDNMNIDVSISFNGFIECYLWQSLLYNLPFDDSFLSYFDFKQEANNMLSCSNTKLSVFQGITGLGLFILKNNYINKN